MFFHSQFDVQELDKERNVILEEISMYDDTPDDLVHDLLAKASYGEHSLGLYDIRYRRKFKCTASEDLRQFMKDHYNIQNTVISVAGNVDDRILELIEQHFGQFANQGVSSEYTLPPFTGEAVYQTKQTEQNHICLSLPGCSIMDERIYGMILLNNTIGGGMSSRLFQEIREKRGLAYSVYSYHSSYMDSGLFTLYTGTAPKQTEEVIEGFVGYHW